MMASKFVFLTVMATMVTTSEATAFLQATPKHASDKISFEDVQTSLLAEIEGSLGTGLASKKIVEMKAILSPMFASLPKNVHGGLEHTAVRYVMHRVFVQRHGWFIEGLDAAGDSWNSSSLTGIMKNQVPAYIENMFEQRMGGRGLGLQELAVYAATVEHLIHNEAIGRLGFALNVHDVLPTALLTPKQVEEVLDTYMMGFVIGWDLSKMTKKQEKNIKGKMQDIYPGWNETQKFVRRVQQEVTSSMSVGSTLQGEQQELSFAVVAKIAEGIGDQFGTFQDHECKALKVELMKMEDHGTGRVRLSDFYKDALEGKNGGWQFQESVAYLRQLGALDESNQDEPRVMISNYLTSQTNCIASSDYYSVCCHNECEELMVNLEKDVASPEATSKRIAAFISALPSSSVSAPRELSATLRTRLDKIGEDHGGSVQLHSRLFAQWMHHAYPRECPYPHMSGTTKQEKADKASVATKDELEQFGSVAKSSDAVKSQAPEDMHDLMMWTQEEELLVARPVQVAATASNGMAGTVRGVAGFAALVSIAVALVRTASPAMDGNAKSSEQKFMV